MNISRAILYYIDRAKPFKPVPLPLSGYVHPFEKPGHLITENLYGSCTVFPSLFIRFLATLSSKCQGSLHHDTGIVFCLLQECVEICKVATLGNSLTFVKHYILDLATRSDAEFGTAACQSLFE